MSTVQYSGALPPKKKSELQEIAEKLSIDSSGTKDDLQTRIKTYLDTNDLSEDPTFSGLYLTKRKMTRKESGLASSMAQSIASDTETSPLIKRKGSTRRKQTPPPPEAENEGAMGTLTAPASPVRALIENVDAAISNVVDKDALVQVASERGSQLRTHALQYLDNSRKFLSNATNIASVTVLLEFFFILYVMIPWQYYQIPVDNSGSGSSVVIPYPPLSYLLSSHLYKQLSYWFIPTVLLPQAAGTLISFSTPRKDVDPLSAGIVKLALAVILDNSWFAVQGKTVSQWRVVATATSLAFALAEATEERRVVVRQQQHDH